MSYIRNRDEERTGVQEDAKWRPEIDLQCDFVMVYGIDAKMPERIKGYKENGYVVHLMVGTAWGDYQDFIYGEFDGRRHSDEAQRTRSETAMEHGENVPYMVPTIAFAWYLESKLRAAIDAGASAIHLEEPEFWDKSGYSEAFKREYEIFYGEKWQPPHSSFDVRYKAAKLKSFLYARIIFKISAELKEYAAVKYKINLKFYVAIHSIINYCQWKIVSPEGLLDIPTVDGVIGQVWTGTSRSPNTYGGVIKERTFENAFFEYGSFQEMVNLNKKRLWLLCDPIEDMPEYTWESYRKNYLKTAVAAMLQSKNDRYEVCPWPHRVFNGIFPKKAGLATGIVGTVEMEGAKSIPENYATLICSISQLFGDLEKCEPAFDGIDYQVGVAISGTALMQMGYPDGVNGFPNGNLNDELICLSDDIKDNGKSYDESQKFMAKLEKAKERIFEYKSTTTFPDFFGLAMPLLKYGLPVKPLLIDNAIKQYGFLRNYSAIVLSYEFIKPVSACINTVLTSWVADGGVLIYVGDEKDLYHSIKGWWNSEGDYNTPTEHLFELMGLGRSPEAGVYSFRKGKLIIIREDPAAITFSAKNAEKYREQVKQGLELVGKEWNYTNSLCLRRGRYIISSVMDESVSDEPLVLKGLFADMFENDYKIITEKTINSDENSVLFDFSRLDENLAVIGSSARVLSLNTTDSGFVMTAKAPDRIKVFIRLRLPAQPRVVTGVDEGGDECPTEWEWDSTSKTLLVSYKSYNQTIKITGEF